jgi:hypothetical protein
MLMLAAWTESYLRQSHLGTLERFAFAGVALALWVLYFTAGFLRERVAKNSSTP